MRMLSALRHAPHPTVPFKDVFWSSFPMLPIPESLRLLSRTFDGGVERFLAEKPANR